MYLKNTSVVKEEIKLISGGKHFHWDKGSEAAEMKRTGKEEGGEGRITRRKRGEGRITVRKRGRDERERNREESE